MKLPIDVPHWWSQTFPTYTIPINLHKREVWLIHLWLIYPQSIWPIISIWLIHLAIDWFFWIQSMPLNPIDSSGSNSSDWFQLSMNYSIQSMIQSKSYWWFNANPIVDDPIDSIRSMIRSESYRWFNANPIGDSIRSILIWLILFILSTISYAWSLANWMSSTFMANWCVVVWTLLLMGTIAPHFLNLWTLLIMVNTIDVAIRSTWALHTREIKPIDSIPSISIQSNLTTPCSFDPFEDLSHRVVRWSVQLIYSLISLNWSF